MSAQCQNSPSPNLQPRGPVLRRMHEVAKSMISKPPTRKLWPHNVPPTARTLSPPMSMRAITRRSLQSEFPQLLSLGALLLRVRLADGRLPLRLSTSAAPGLAAPQPNRLASEL